MEGRNRTFRTAAFRALMRPSLPPLPLHAVPFPPLCFMVCQIRAHSPEERARLLSTMKRVCCCTDRPACHLCGERQKGAAGAPTRSWAFCSPRSKRPTSPSRGLCGSAAAAALLRRREARARARTCQWHAGVVHWHRLVCSLFSGERASLPVIFGALNLLVHSRSAWCKRICAALSSKKHHTHG